MDNQKLPKSVTELKRLIKETVPRNKGGGGPGYFFELLDTPTKSSGYQGAYKDSVGKYLKVAPNGKTLSWAPLDSSTDTIIAVGDSWAARHYSFNGLDVAYSDLGVLTWALALSGQKVRVDNPTAGVGGSTSADWLNLIGPALADRTPRYVLCILGINDLAQDVPEATVRQNLETVYTAILDSGATLLAANIAPFGPGYTVVGDSLATKNLRRARINQWIASFVASKSKCHLIDQYSALIDPTNVNGYMLAANADTNPTNGIHASAQGARRVGQLVANVINSEIPYASNFHASSYTDGYEYSSSSTNKVSNCLLTASGGTSSAGSGTTITATAIAQGWTVSTLAGAGTVVCTLPARTLANNGDVLGNSQRLEVTGANSTTQITFNVGSLAARFTAGDIVEAEVFLRVSGASGLQGIRLSAQSSADSVPEVKSAMSYLSSGASYDQSDALLVLRTPPITIRSGSLSSTLIALVIKFGAAGGGTFDIGRVSWRKLNP
jgi:lysophospholipase L1-like esterase